jgi:hypothetical protein
VPILRSRIFPRSLRHAPQDLPEPSAHTAAPFLRIPQATISCTTYNGVPSEMPARPMVQIGSRSIESRYLVRRNGCNQWQLRFVLLDRRFLGPPVTTSKPLRPRSCVASLRAYGPATPQLLACRAAFELRLEAQLHNRHSCHPFPATR